MRKRVLKATLRDRFWCGVKHSKLNSVFLQTDGADRMLVEQPFIESVFGSSLFFDLHGVSAASRARRRLPLIQSVKLSVVLEPELISSFLCFM